MPHAPLIIDIAGAALTVDDRRRIAHPPAGGVILFTRNWQSRQQIAALTAAIRAIRPDALIAIDHEGGRVQRFREGGFTPLPPMRALGRLWEEDALQALAAATACGYVLAAELRACGIDLSFTPVLDLDWGRSAVIGDRALHPQEDAEEQVSLAERFGLRLAFHPLDQEQYLATVAHWLGRPLDSATRQKALQYALAHGSRSARVAAQCARSLR